MNIQHMVKRAMLRIVGRKSNYIANKRIEE